MLYLGTNENISNEEYHGDRNFLSSSSLKLLLQDREAFRRKYILQEIDEPKKNQSALDFGTAAHLMLLEPHLFDSEVVFFNGPRKAGKVFEEFKLQNEGKLILTEVDKMKLDAFKSSFENHHASWILKDCKFEHTMCALLNSTMLKSRADAISIGGGYIVDVKTTGYMGDVETFKQTIENLYYDLSAALYCAIAEKIYKKQFDFYFIVLSKSDMSCNVYKMSKNTMLAGYGKLESAIETYKNCLLTGNWSDVSVEEEEITNIISEV